MKISEEYTAYKTLVPKVVEAFYEGSFTIRIRFSDNSEQTIDFRNFIDKSKIPSIAKYKTEANFRSFEVKNGNLNWNDYDMIFPLSDLHNGQI